MVDTLEQEYADTLEVEGDTKSSARVLSAIKKAERALNEWQALCDCIDDTYSRKERYSEDWVDPDYDLFWSSMEIMKPAVYAHPPQPVVSPQFKDRRPLQNTTAELLERTAISSFDRTGIDEAMCCTRDDLIFYNRGQLWLTYETTDGQRVCVEHLDRKDFLHPPARKWSEVPWVARRAWMTKAEMRKRFRKNSGDAYQQATFKTPTQRDDDGGTDHSRKTGVWEVWHKADDRVYWVAEGVDVMLDEDAPHLKLRGFFPCPRPAYGTLRPRTLVPVPDYLRYAGHFKKINSLTRRIYALLDMIRMKGLIPAGGDIGDAVEQALADDDNAALLIPVPGAALIQGAGDFVQWMPLADIATAIQGLIEARRELFSDYDRLSGISDIMRGETEAEETLGAQQLKSQYGSVRVREKIEELQRIARDVTQIAAEIMADKFTEDTLLEMSQMEIPTKADIEKRVEKIEEAAEKDMKALGEKARQAAMQTGQDGQQIDPAQAQQQLQQAQQQIIAKYGPMLQQASEQVPIEDVMKLLRDDKARGFAFEIATDSTILTDELQEKQSRNEFLREFTAASQGLAGLAAMGEAGAKLAGEMLKFVLQPYRVGRELNSVIDEFIDSAPQMAAQAAGQGQSDTDKAIAEANQQLAKAEMEKARAATMKVEADAAAKAAEHERKIGELQAKMAKDRQDSDLKLADAQTKAGDAMTKADKTAAEIDKIRAETAAILNSIGLDERAQEVDEYKAATDVQMRQTEQAQAAIGQQQGMAMDARKAGLADRQQAHSEQQSQRAENRADRQQAYSERSGDRQQALAERQAAKEPAQ
jgi:hypothetical protein